VERKQGYQTNELLASTRANWIYRSRLYYRYEQINGFIGQHKPVAREGERETIYLSAFW
jgi:hypothetical protein